MVIRSNRNVVAKTSIKNDVTTSKRYVKAADEDEFDDIDFDEVADEESDGIMDAIDDVADNVEEIQDTIDDMEEDQVMESSAKLNDMKLILQSTITSQITS